MSDDPLDRFAAGLFEAARQELPPEGAERRALRAALPELDAAPSLGRRPRSLLLLVAAASALLLSVAVLKPDRTEVSIAAEHPSALPKRASTRLPATSAPPHRPPLPAELPATVTSAAPKASRAERAAPTTLQDELEALRVAERSLSAGDSGAALKALDRYDRLLKGQKLRAEATLLRIEALSKAGQGQAAAELAERFAKQNPNNPLVDRARSFIQPSESDGVGGE